MSNKLPLISIIVPIYKVEDLLGRCVESVISQTYSNIEIILVDDGSPDECPGICDEYAKKDSRIVVLHQCNQGLSAARNNGVKISKGEYIFYVDSDDYLSNDAIAILYKSIVENDCDIAVGEMQKVYEITPCSFQKIDSYVTTVFHGIEITRMLLSGKADINFIVAWNKLIKRDLAKDILFPVGKYHEDEFVNWKFFLNSEKVCFVNKKTYFYYQRTTSITGNGFGNHMFGYLEALQERVNYLFENNSEELFLIALNYYRLELMNYFYLQMCILDETKDLELSLSDIHELFKKSYEDYPNKMNKSLISTKVVLKEYIFYYFPGILRQFVKIRKFLTQ